MKLDRREVLVVGSAAILVAATGAGKILRQDAACVFLHSTDQTPQDLSSYRLDLFQRGGFSATTAVLDQARGRSLMAQLNDADALVVEAMLRGRGIQIRRGPGKITFVADL